jgi:hypothetical protein
MGGKKLISFLPLLFSIQSLESRLMQADIMTFSSVATPLKNSTHAPYPALQGQHIMAPVQYPTPLHSSALDHRLPKLSCSLLQCVKLFPCTGLHTGLPLHSTFHIVDLILSLSLRVIFQETTPLIIALLVPLTAPSLIPPLFLNQLVIIYLIYLLICN